MRSRRRVGYQGRILIAVASLLSLSAFVSADGVSGSSGAFLQTIPIQVPTFHALEPRLALGYSSQGGNGFAGVGWGLGGFGVLERFSPGLGSPRYDASDIYTLNGAPTRSQSRGKPDPT
jgi:hypothetical protein